MNNKVLVKLIVPKTKGSYDVYLPVNDVIWRVVLLSIKSIYDMIGISFTGQERYVLINKDTGKIYNNNEIIIDTDIRNGTNLILWVTKSV